MKRAVLLISTALLCLPAAADLLPPQAHEAAMRLRANPDAFDRIDNFCSDKKRGDACTIPGSVLAGGGEGVCKNELNRSTFTIDLSCEREGRVAIDRKLPEGGFVHDDSLCRQQAKEAASGNVPPGESRWNCAPLDPMPADRFCQGKAAGNACAVELRYQGTTQTHEGVCKQVREFSGFYYQGRRTATREVIRCEPETAVTRTFSPVSWWKKLLQ